MEISDNYSKGPPPKKKRTRTEQFARKRSEGLNIRSANNKPFLNVSSVDELNKKKYLFAFGFCVSRPDCVDFTGKLIIASTAIFYLAPMNFFFLLKIFILSNLFGRTDHMICNPAINI